MTSPSVAAASRRGTASASGPGRSRRAFRRDREDSRQGGMIGLGRMGANMVRRWLRRGHECVVHDVSRDAVRALAGEGAIGCAALGELVERLRKPRVVWLMVPAAAVDATTHDLAPNLTAGDVIVDAGNSYYRDDIDRAKSLAKRGLDYVDCEIGRASCRERV